MSKTKTETETKPLVDVTQALVSYNGKPIVNDPTVPCSALKGIAEWVLDQAHAPAAVRNAVLQIQEQTVETLTLRLVCCRALDMVERGKELSLDEKMRRGKLQEQIFWNAEVELSVEDRALLRALINKFYLQPSTAISALKLLE